MAASLPIATFHALDDQPSVISFPRDRKSSRSTMYAVCVSAGVSCPRAIRNVTQSFLTFADQPSNASIQGATLLAWSSTGSVLRSPSSTELRRLESRWPERGIGLHRQGKHGSGASEAQ
jgi:hypothetical protein